MRLSDVTYTLQVLTIQLLHKRCITLQVLTIQRNLTPIVPHGHTKLQANDEVMICGRPNSLSNVTAMKKGKVVLVLQAGRKLS